MKRHVILLTLSLVLLGRSLAWAQASNASWYFGEHAALHFTAGQPLPVAVSGSGLTTYEACASVSNASGQLLFYTNGEQIWDRNNTVMPNGGGIRSHISASQGALVLPDFVDIKKYYLFTVDGCENLFAAGLRYSIVDMSLRGGLGDVGSLKNIALVSPSPQSKVTEKLTAVRHANGRDYWIVVHGWENNEFYSYLFSAAGVAATPRVSAVGAVHTGGGGLFGNTNGVGHLKASPNGRLLACAIRDQAFQLFDFDPATGLVSNARTLGVTAPYYYGAEFSPDGTKLYTTDLPGNSLYQIDVANNLQVTQVASTSAATGAVQRGPDGLLYVAMDRRSYLGVITQPNKAGAACGFIEEGVSLNGGICRIGLPNAVTEVNAPIAASINVNTAVCAGSVLGFAGAVAPAIPAATFSWDFGDPTSGSANKASGPTPTHRYNTSGSYVVTLTVSNHNQQISATKTIVVSPLPTLSLGARQQLLCAGGTLTITASEQPSGTSFQWQDKSTLPTLLVKTPGHYVLRVTSPQGCIAKDSVDVTTAPRPVVSLRSDTLLCGNDVITLYGGPQPAGSTYRWQDGSTAASFQVRAPGAYTLEVRNAAGCTNQDSFIALPGPCPSIISNNAAICVGTTLTFTGSSEALQLSPTFTWNFGDPRSGAADMATGLTTTHRFDAPGDYIVTLLVARQGKQYSITKTVVVKALPTLTLGPRQQELCAGGTLTLTPSAQPSGTVFHWQDNSASPVYQVRSPGRYILSVTSPQGCIAKDSVEVKGVLVPVVQLRPDTLLCGDNIIELHTGPQPAGSTYRWQDGSTGASFRVMTPGTYLLEVRNAAGCVSKDEFIALPGPCPFTIPNIITPNGDTWNQTLVLKGLHAADWTIMVYDRWGSELFHQNSYDNSWAAQGLPDGIYYYLLTNASTGQRYKGWVEVVR